MFDRALFKTNAKNVLRKTYWLSFGVALLGGIISGASAGGINFNIGSLSRPTQITNGYLPYFFIIFLVIFLFALAIGLAYSAFLGGPVIAGMKNFFIRARNGEAEFSNMFSTFKKGRYIKTVKVMFKYNIFIILWSLLFCIPGIVKSYEYFAVPYIIAANPDIDSKRAFEISRQMTEGHKGDIFVTDLSFIGWGLLAVCCTCGIGMYFLYPYIYATKAEIFTFLKYKAFANNICTPEELCEMPVYNTVQSFENSNEIPYNGLN